MEYIVLFIKWLVGDFDKENNGKKVDEAILYMALVIIVTVILIVCGIW